MSCKIYEQGVWRTFGHTISWRRLSSTYELLASALRLIRSARVTGCVSVWYALLVLPDAPTLYVRPGGVHEATIQHMGEHKNWSQGHTIHDSSRYMPGGVCEATDKDVVMIAAFRYLPGGICEATHVKVKKWQHTCTKRCMHNTAIWAYMYEKACTSDAAQGLTEELDLCAPRFQGLRQALDGVNTRIRLPRPRPLTYAYR